MSGTDHRPDGTCGSGAVASGAGGADDPGARCLGKSQAPGSYVPAMSAARYGRAIPVQQCTRDRMTGRQAARLLNDMRGLLRARGMCGDPIAPEVVCTRHRGHGAHELGGS